MINSTVTTVCILSVVVKIVINKVLMFGVYVHVRIRTRIGNQHIIIYRRCIKPLKHP